MAREILVVRREALFPTEAPHGFVEEQGQQYLQTILQNYEYHERTDVLEHDPSLKQIIPYVWILNLRLQKVFLYKRVPSNNPEYTEQRYLNKYSGGLGGHIDRDTEEHSSDPIHDAMMRELKEEVSLHHYPEPRIVGYVNDDTDSLGEVHFGVVAIAESDEDGIQVTDGGVSGAFYSPSEVDALFADPGNKVETWTMLSWPFLKQYILSRVSE